VPYGQKPRNGKETARPTRRQPTKFNGSGARVAVQEDECSICSDDDSSQSDYAGSILPAPARYVAHAASARATSAGAGMSNLSFTGASAGELFGDEDVETDSEGAADAFIVHHAYFPASADAHEPATDLPAPAAVPVLAAPYADELNNLGLLATTSRSWRREMAWDAALAATRLDLNPVAPAAEPEPAKPHDGWLDAHDGPNAQWAAEEWQAEIKANSISTKRDDEPEIDSYADFAQDDCDDIYYDAREPALLNADFDPGDLELGQIDAGAIFAQCGIDDVGPWSDMPERVLPERVLCLPRPEPEGTDFAARHAARAGLLPDPDVAEPDPVEMHK